MPIEVRAELDPLEHLLDVLEVMAGHVAVELSWVQSIVSVSVPVLSLCHGEEAVKQLLLLKRDNALV